MKEMFSAWKIEYCLKNKMILGSQVNFHIFHSTYALQFWHLNRSFISYFFKISSRSFLWNEKGAGGWVISMWIGDCG